MWTKIATVLLGLSLGLNAALGILYLERKREVVSSRQAFWAMRHEYDRYLRSDAITRQAQQREQEGAARLESLIAKSRR